MPGLLKRLLIRFGAHLRRDAASEDMGEEIRYHLERETERNIASGMSPTDASLAARTAIGNEANLRQEMREAVEWRWLADHLRDAASALRALRRSPGVTLTAVLILGIGIGAATAMVSVFHAAVLQRLPVSDQNRLAVLWPLREGGVEVPFTKEQLEHLNRESRTLEAVAGFAHWGNYDAAMRLNGQDVSLRLTVVTGNWFQVLAASPALGRLLLPGEVASDGVAVLSFGAWQRKFGGDSSIVGKQLNWPLTRQKFTVVGVAPPGIDYPVGTEVWTPDNAAWSFDGVARLRAGATVQSAKAEVAALVTSGPLGFPDNLVVGAFAQDLPTMVYGSVRPALLAMVAATGLLLLIACINVGNLLLLKAADRTREIAVRRALGASPSAIFRQLAWESSLLGIIGGLIGIALAILLLRLLLVLAPADLPRIDTITLAGPALVIGLLVTLVTVFATGLAPIIGTRLTASDGPLVLGGGRTVSEGPGRRRVRRLLVAGQVTLAVVLLHGCGLLIRSLVRLETLELGYQTERLTFVQLIPPTNADAQAQPSQTWFTLLDRLLPELRAVPGVVGASPLAAPPFTGSNTFTTALEAEGPSTIVGKTTSAVSFDAVGPDFFRAMDLPVIRGRGFTGEDRVGTVPVAVLTRTIAEWLWPDEDPVGRRVRLTGDTGVAKWRTVIGVVPDLHFREYRTSTPTIFFEASQIDFWQGGLVVRTRGNAVTAIREVRATIERVTPEFGFQEAKSMDEWIRDPLAKPRLFATLISGFGSVALLLAVIGLSAVVAWSVRRRYRELGIRIALGAGPNRLRGQVLREALLPVWAGGAVGAVLALMASRLVRGLLFEVSPADPFALVIAVVLLVLAGVAAGYLPARRATRIDPVRALQTE
jgi:putative ABC transport system permease protein